MEERTVSYRNPPRVLPEVVVFYSPRTKTLGIEAGSSVPAYTGETVANFMIARYDNDNKLLSLDIDGAESALEPLIDAVLRQDGKPTGTLVKRSACFVDPDPKNWGGPLEDVVVFYTPETQALRIQAGDPVSVHRSEAVARGMTAHYNAEGTLVAVDLEPAELLLKPFLDAVRTRQQAKAARTP